MIVNELVKSALRKLGALSTGREVEPSEGEEALAVLRQMYLEMIGNGTFGRQYDLAVAPGGVDFVAQENSRLLTDNLASQAITLPELVQDAWIRWDYGRYWTPPAVSVGPSWTGNRPPLDGALVTLADLSSSQVRTYVYDSSMGRWTDLNNIQLADYAPLSMRYGDGLACELAIRLAPEYGGDVPASIVLGAARGRSAMVNRFDGPERTVRGQFY